MLNRRAFLSSGLGALGFVAGSPLLASCSSSGVDANEELWQIVQRFPQVLVPGDLRLPISLADQAGLLADGDLPATLTARLVNAETGATVASDLVATRHDAGLSIPYWPFRVNVADVGLYSLVVDGGPQEGAAVQVLDPSEVTIPLVGSPLPAFDTPTVDDARGVDPICTRTPEPCPFHDVTLTDALASGRPVVYLIGTPAHCSTGTCSPALDGLLELRDELLATYVIVHAEVYTDDTATQVAPAVTSYAMTYEPALFVTGRDGTIVERLDAVFDSVELREVLLS